MKQTVRLAAALLVSVGAAALVPVRAQEMPAAFIPAPVSKTTEIAPEVREQVLAEVARRDPRPQHIVVLIHGFDTSFNRSREEYSQTAEALQAEFRKQGERVSVVGVQWPSDVGALREWLPKSLAHHFLNVVGFKKAVKDPYKMRREMSYSVGRLAVRQLLLDLRDRFPLATRHVFVHSLGSEIIAHAIDPTPDEDERNKEIKTYLPNRSVDLGMIVFAGADLDQDHALPTLHPESGTSDLMWVTVPERGASKDRVLVLRKLTRGKAALGNRAPKLTDLQLDALLSQRRLVFDTREIPKDHEFLSYYRPERLGRMVDAALSLRDADKHPSEFLKTLEQIVEAPKESELLRTSLRSEDATVRLYALWRLEHLYCGGSGHIVDGAAMKVAELALTQPEKFEKLRKTVPCKVCSEGLIYRQDLLTENKSGKDGAK